MKRVEFMRIVRDLRHEVAKNMRQRSVRGQLPIPDNNRRLLILGLLLSRNTQFTPQEMREIVNSLKTDHV